MVSRGFAQEGIASAVAPPKGGEEGRVCGGRVALEQALLRQEDVRRQLEKTSGRRVPRSAEAQLAARRGAFLTEDCKMHDATRSGDVAATARRCGSTGNRAPREGCFRRRAGWE